MLVVEDSLTVRKLLCDTLAAAPDVVVVAEASNGQDAIQLCQSLRPDVITLDMHLPVMSGLSATEFIMAHCPTPILIVSASTNRGDLYKTYDALAAGAVDVLEKPRGDASDETWNERFLAAVRLVAKIRVITHPRGRLEAARPRPSQLPRTRVDGGSPLPLRILALGASTGGPSALVRVLRDVPPSLGLQVLLVLHIDEPFGAAFADWLSEQTEHRVRFAVDGEPLEGSTGHVLMAPPGRHLSVLGSQLKLSNGPERHSCRPSIDVLFESLAEAAGARSGAALLTGMGRDGAAGLLALRRAGCLTVAQDEESSVVFGMPKEAAVLGAAAQVLPLGEIGRFFVEAALGRKRASS